VTRRAAHAARAATLLLLLLAPAGCSRTTARLSPEMQRRLESEGVLRRADEELFRYTHGMGTRRGGWEEMTASIIVTRQTVMIHRNEKTLLEITPRSAGGYRVNRDHDRLSIRAGSGRSARSWSFHPPGDAAGWAGDIRGVLRAPAGAASAGSG